MSNRKIYRIKLTSEERESFAEVAKGKRGKLKVHPGLSSVSAQRGRPLGDEGWVESIARRLNLESTMRPRGRKRVHFPKVDIKEA